MNAIDCNFGALFGVRKFNPNHGAGGRFASASDSSGFDALDKRLVDYKPDRSLSDPTKVMQITHMLPDTSYVSYGKTPFLDKMHAAMGVTDPMTMPVHEYMAARKALFAKQPEEQLPLHNMVVTQRVVNTDKIAEGIHKGHETYGHMPIDAVRYDGQNYIMNGHHRAVSAAARGDATIAARVLDLGGPSTKFDFTSILKHNPYHGPDGRFSSGDGASFVSFGGVFSKSNERDRQKYQNDTTGRFRDQIKALADRGIKMRVFGTNDADEIQKAWSNPILNGVTPTEVVNAFIGTKGKVETNGWNGARLDLSGGKIIFTGSSVTNFFGGKANDIQRVINLRDNSVEHSYLKLDPTTQGAGVVKQLFASCIPLYEKLGVTRIDVHANLDAGGYAWARYGFDTKSGSSQRSFAAQTISRVQSGLNAIRFKNPLTEEQKSEAQALQSVFAKYGKSPMLPSMITAVKTPNLDSAYRSIVGVKHGLLAGTMGSMNWYGKLDLTNKRQMKNMGTYISGKPLKAFAKST